MREVLHEPPLPQLATTFSLKNKLDSRAGSNVRDGQQQQHRLEQSTSFFTPPKQLKKMLPQAFSIASLPHRDLELLFNWSVDIYVQVGTSLCFYIF